MEVVCTAQLRQSVSKQMGIRISNHFFKKKIMKFSIHDEFKIMNFFEWRQMLCLNTIQIENNLIDVDVDSRHAALIRTIC
jgi:hypothetical protein